MWLPPDKTCSYSHPNKSFPDFKIVSWFQVKIVFLSNQNHHSVSSKFQHHQVSEATNPTSKQTLQFSFSNWESQCNSMQQINATQCNSMQLNATDQCNSSIHLYSLIALIASMSLGRANTFFTLLAMPWSLYQDCSSEQINCSDPHPIHPSLIWRSKQSLLVSAEKASTSKMTTEKLQSALIYHQLKSS